MIYADFENILVPQDNEIPSPNMAYTNKYQNRVPGSYCYHLVCVDDKFSRYFKQYLDKYAI